jgi:hypothetical protein
MKQPKPFMNEFQKYQQEQNKEIKKLVSKAKYVFAWVMLSQDGLYLEVKKGSVRQGMIDYPEAYDIHQFDLRTDGNLYIN